MHVASYYIGLILSKVPRGVRKAPPRYVKRSIRVREKICDLRVFLQVLQTARFRPPTISLPSLSTRRRYYTHGTNSIFTFSTNIPVSPNQNKSTKMADNIYDEIEIEDMTFDSTLQIYHYPCPCGDRFEIGIADLREGEEIAVCPSCSLMIKVIFDAVRPISSCTHIDDRSHALIKL